MKITEIRDECSKCGEIVTCELCRKGHGIRRPRESFSEMVECQLEHMMKRERET